jgi:hypothetical protein
MFEDGTAVFEELFTHSLFFIDRVWLERNATRDQFPKVGYVGGSQIWVKSVLLLKSLVPRDVCHTAHPADKATT